LKIHAQVDEGGLSQQLELAFDSDAKLVQLKPA